MKKRNYNGNARIIAKTASRIIRSGNMVRLLPQCVISVTIMASQLISVSQCKFDKLQDKFDNRRIKI